MRAIWNGQILAESDETIVVEGNHYFPPTALNSKFFEPSDHESTCPWKGLASYYNLKVEGASNKNAAWYYSNPSEKASNIKDYVAFWKGVEVK
jgi:uncharacterized protein (DUF427 family)